MTELRAVLFDMDDTLFDHQHASRGGLAAIRCEHECLQSVSIEVLEREYIAVLEDLHLQVLAGSISPEDARAERFSHLLFLHGRTLSRPEALEIARRYRVAYQTSRRAVPGAVALLERLRPLARVVIVTNNFVAEQQDKLRVIGLESLVDGLVTSEEVGAAKPSRLMFDAALARAGCRAGEAVMVGDSWPADVLGARAVGLRTIWLNRWLLPCPDPALAAEIRALEPTEAVLHLILDQRRVPNTPSPTAVGEGVGGEARPGEAARE